MLEATKEAKMERETRDLKAQVGTAILEHQELGVGVGIYWELNSEIAG